MEPLIGQKNSVLVGHHAIIGIYQLLYQFKIRIIIAWACSWTPRERPAVHGLLYEEYESSDSK